MKIFFDSSLSGRKFFEENYRLIDKELKNLGHEVLSAVFLSTTERVAEETEEESAKYYEDLSKWLREYDVLVFEVSHSSLGIGLEIAWGLQLGKPIIALYSKEGKRPYVLEAMNSERVQIFEYDKEDIGEILKDSVEYAATLQDTRFTMLLQSDITNFLDSVADAGKTRSEYIRDLIRKDMKK